MTNANGSGTAELDTFRAMVEAANEKGIKLDGQWFDYSKFGAASRVTRASAGDVVEVTVKGRFIQALTILDAPETAEPPESVESEPHVASQVTISDHELRIVREACLHAASRFCATRLELKSAEMLALAERLEAWVLR